MHRNKTASDQLLKDSRSAITQIELLVGSTESCGLDEMKEKLEAFSGIPAMIKQVENLGAPGAEDATALKAAQSKLCAWAPTKLQEDQQFQAILGKITTHADGLFGSREEGPLMGERAAKSYDATVPTAPPEIDQAFMLRCLLARLAKRLVVGRPG